MMVSGTPRIPRLVSRTAGGSAKITVAISAVAGPMLKSSTRGIRYENAGIVCAASSSGRKMLFTRSRRPAHTPSGTPIANAATTPRSISTSVSRASAQSPKNPMARNPDAASTAIRQPAATPATAAAATTTPSQVIRSRNRTS